MEKRERDREWHIIEGILDRYYKENSPELERAIGKMLRLMELGISPKVI